MSSAPDPLRALLVATRNRSKAVELESFVTKIGLRVITLDDIDVPRSHREDNLEQHATFEANAVAKARFYHVASGGLPTVSDDSGLEVEALGGEPGVHSRRWAGASGSDAEVSAANNSALLRRLLGSGDRAARFTCVVAYVSARRELIHRGEVRGRIAQALRGTHGFGYDPLFEAAELSWRTFGEVTAVEKARVSHRARAMERLTASLESR